MIIFRTDHITLGKFFYLTDKQQEDLFEEFKSLERNKTICKYDLVIDKVYHGFYKCEVVEFLGRPYPDYQRFVHFDFDEELDSLNFNKFKKQLVYKTI